MKSMPSDLKRALLLCPTKDRAAAILSGLRMARLKKERNLLLKQNPTDKSSTDTV